MRYNKCTNTQESNFNQVPMTGYGAFEVRILADGNVLVADSDSVLLMDPNGNVIQTYSCASLPGCQGLLFAVSVDPDGTSFWTGDSVSGDVWQVDIATGQVLQTFQTNPGYLYGLSVDGQLMAATSPPPVTSTPTTLTVQPVQGNFSSPTPVSAVLTNPDTNAPVSGEPVTFTLNGSETCTATTDDTGTATCVITPGEPSSSYTLTASFSGDTTTTTPLGSDSSSSTFNVNPDTSSVTYTGPTSAVNGTTPTVGATLTTNTPTPDTPLSNQVVSFTVGSGGSNPQTCSGTTDDNGDVSCTLPTLDQPVTDTSITTSYGGTSYDTPVTSAPPFTVTEPTTLTVNSATGGYAMSTPVSGVLTDTLSGAPIANEPVTLQLDSNESCQAVTDTTGTATCNVTPSEPEGTYPLTGTFAGDTSQPLQLLPSNGLSNFVVTPDATSLTYTGATTGVNGQALAVSGVLTRVFDGAPIAGRNVTFTLGTGTKAQTCSGVTNATGAVACSIASVNQSPGPIPVTDTFAGDNYYLPASAASTVNLPEGTKLTVNPGGGTYNGSTTVSGTLTNTTTNQPVPNEPVTFTVNGSQTCTGTTNASGVASCSVTPTEPKGTYSETRVVRRGHHDDAATAGNQWDQHVQRQPGTDDVGLHGPDDVDQRRIRHAHRRADQQRAHRGHAGQRADGDVHHRLGELGAELHGHDQRERAGELHHRQGQPEQLHRHAHGQVRRQHVLRDVLDHGHAGHRHADEPLGRRRERGVRPVGDALGHIDQRSDRKRYQRSDGHAHAQRRRAVVHRDDELDAVWRRAT